ncbi:MAG: hypothetical protein IK124_00785 [Prevotella sp.]|nr:hypothetical protein [Prevotella sp.]
MDINKNNTTLEKILDSYVKRGFGSMTKNDFEVWIFHQLLKGKLHGKTNREISIYLRIPDTKVKRLRYEADLKWGKPDDDTTYHDALVDVIKKARLVKNRKQILFVIEDTALLKYLDAKMKTAEVSWDKSFNSENIFIDFEQYELFCKDVLNSEYKEAVDFLNKKFKDKNSIAKFFEELSKKTREEILKELSGGAIELTKKSLPLLLSII